MRECADDGRTLDYLIVPLARATTPSVRILPGVAEPVIEEQRRQGGTAEAQQRADPVAEDQPLIVREELIGMAKGPVGGSA